MIKTTKQGETRRKGSRKIHTARWFISLYIFSTINDDKTRVNIKYRAQAFCVKLFMCRFACICVWMRTEKICHGYTRIFVWKLIWFIVIAAENHQFWSCFSFLRHNFCWVDFVGDYFVFGLKDQAKYDMYVEYVELFIP